MDSSGRERLQRLERELRGLARAIDYPPAADLTRGVRSAIETGRAPKRRLLHGWTPELGRHLALAGAAAVVLAVAVLSFSPTAREAVADLLGLRGVEIRVTESPPPSASPPAGPLSGYMDVGERVTLAEAREAVGYEIRLPTDQLGPPDEVYLSEGPEDRVTSFFRSGPGLPRIYETGTGAMLTQFIGALDRNTIGKLATEDTTIERVEVNGHRGLWVEGDHLFFLYRSEGTVIEETIRMSDSALLWQEGEVTLRLESGLSREAAIRLAESAY